jgi:hypothetical protein
MILIHRRIEADATGLDPEVVDISPPTAFIGGVRR